MINISLGFLEHLVVQNCCCAFCIKRFLFGDT